jgi:hypothetical protein
MLFLLFIFVFCGFLKSYQSLRPELGEMVAQQGDAFGIQFVNAACAGAAVADEPRLLENTKVLRHSGPGDGQASSEFVDGVGTGAEHFEDG